MTTQEGTGFFLKKQSWGLEGKRSSFLSKHIERPFIFLSCRYFYSDPWYRKEVASSSFSNNSTLFFQWPCVGTTNFQKLPGLFYKKMWETYWKWFHFHKRCVCPDVCVCLFSSFCGGSVFWHSYERLCRTSAEFLSSLWVISRWGLYLARSAAFLELRENCSRICCLFVFQIKQ